MIPGSYTGLPCWPIRGISMQISLSVVRLFSSIQVFLSDGISTITGVGTTGAAIGGTDSWSSITTGLSPGVTPLLIAGTEYAVAKVFEALGRLVFRVAPRVVGAERSTIELIAGSPRRAWNPINAPAHSVDSTTAAWQPSTPSAASPASAEVCMVEASPAERAAVSAAPCMVAEEAPCVVAEEAVGMEEE